MRRMPPLNVRKSSQMVRRLLGNPLWLLGFCIVAFGLVVQVVALSVASISVVQAVAPTGTALLLVLSHIFLGDRLRRAEYFGIAALVVALGLLVLSLDSHSDQATGSASVSALLLVTIPAVGASAVFFVLAGRVQRREIEGPDLRCGDRSVVRVRGTGHEIDVDVHAALRSCASGAAHRCFSGVLHVSRDVLPRLPDVSDGAATEHHLCVRSGQQCLLHRVLHHCGRRAVS